MLKCRSNQSGIKNWCADGSEMAAWERAHDGLEKQKHMGKLTAWEKGGRQDVNYDSVSTLSQNCYWQLRV